jgi:hypothetical protein
MHSFDHITSYDLTIHFPIPVQCFLEILMKHDVVKGNFTVLDAVPNQVTGIDVKVCNFNRVIVYSEMTSFCMSDDLS